MVGPGYESLMTADYSQIEMRIMAHLSERRGADRGVPLRARTSTPRRRRRCSASRRARSPRSMRAKIKAMNYGLAYGLSAFGLSQQLEITPGEAQGADGRLLPDASAGSATTCSGVVEEARRSGYTETDHGAASLPARPHQRQPAAARDGRADGAQRARSRGRPPTSSRSRCCGVDRALRRRAARRGCCCRCTTSSCSRSPPVSASSSRPWCAGRWAPRPSWRAARRLRRHRSQLARGRALTCD